MKVCVALLTILSLVIHVTAQDRTDAERSDLDTELERLLSEIQRGKETREGSDGSDERALEDEQEVMEERSEDTKAIDDPYSIYKKTLGDNYGEEREERGMNSLTQAQQQSIVDMHNKLRLKQGASNMELMRFSPKLAQMAQSYSQGCSGQHSNSISQGIGESYAIHSAKDWKPENGVQAWYDEIKDYNYDSNSCSGVCGHYTALVWAKTNEVGCGITFCGNVGGIANAHFLICNYAPAGNFQGEKPFKKGKACTQCDSGKFFCNNNLCDSKCTGPGKGCDCKADCKNGGKKTKDCRCQCKGGSMGPNCADSCKDIDPMCGQNPGLPKEFCEEPSMKMKERCPKLCKVCKSKRSDSDLLKRLLVEYLERDLDDE